ncbi:hypothetical protein RYX36_027639, partial [Vicia faba]
MITGKDIYNVFSAIVPLYVAMLLAYGSVRWWKIFTPDQCSGINRFVGVFAVPVLSFHFISSNDPYAMNFRFLAADSLQKVVILVALFLWNMFTKNQDSLDWTITFFSLSTLPNTLVMGIPLLSAIAAKILISQQFPETSASITSIVVDSDVVSLSGREPLQTDAVIGDNGKIRVVVRRSTDSMMPRVSNLTGVEMYSVQSSRDQPTPRVSTTSINLTDSYAMFQSVNELIENMSMRERDVEGENVSKKKQMPPATVITKLILIMVWRKLIRNPNTYASLLGLVWALISYRWHIEMSLIVKGSIAIISNTGLGMAMFSLGLFMALQPKLISGKRVATFSMAVRFIIGPAVIAATSIAVGIRGTLLHVSIVQAALPRGIVPFVFAKDYNLHPVILSNA